MNEMLVNANSYSIPLADESVDCCVTSPPYLNLRDYIESHGQAGAEAIHDCFGWVTGDYCNKCYTCNTIKWTDEVKRVLRPHGTLWLNLGTSYNGSGGSGGDYNKGGLREGQPKRKGAKIDVLKAKDLIAVPWHVGLALQHARGWWLRNDAIWYAPNRMPEGGVTDRLSRDHEYILILSKSNKYYFDKDAIRVPYTKPLNRWGGDELVADGKSEWAESTGQDAYRNREQRPDLSGRMCRTILNYDDWDEGISDVRKINTSGERGSHYAKFPKKLPEFCIKAGTSEKGNCPVCGTPWKRVVDRKFTGEYNDREAKKQQERNTMSGGIDRVTLGKTEHVKREHLGWEAQCEHKNEQPVPAIILDPFIGSGTTLLASRELGRRGIGIDLSFHYLTNDAQRRLETDKQRQWKSGIETSNMPIDDMFSMYNK